MCPVIKYHTRHEHRMSLFLFLSLFGTKWNNTLLESMQNFNLYIYIYVDIFIEINAEL